MKMTKKDTSQHVLDVGLEALVVHGPLSLLDEAALPPPAPPAEAGHHHPVRRLQRPQRLRHPAPGAQAGGQHLRLLALHQVDDKNQNQSID